MCYVGYKLAVRHSDDVVRQSDASSVIDVASDLEGEEDLDLPPYSAS